MIQISVFKQALCVFKSRLAWTYKNPNQRSQGQSRSRKALIIHLSQCGANMQIHTEQIKLHFHTFLNFHGKHRIPTYAVSLLLTIFIKELISPSSLQMKSVDQLWHTWNSRIFNALLRKSNSCWNILAKRRGLSTTYFCTPGNSSITERP